MLTHTDQKASLSSESIGTKCDLNRKMQGYRRSGLYQAVSALIIVCSFNVPFCDPAQSVSQRRAGDSQKDLSQADLKILDGLEERFSFNQHQSLAIEKRVEDLEVEVFGEVKKGSLEQRVIALKKATTGYEQPALDARSETTLSKQLSKPGDNNAGAEIVKQHSPESETVDDLLEEATRQFGKGELASAKRTLKKVLVLDKHNADAYFNLGAIAEAKADLDSAVEEYQHCLQERPSDNEAQEALASVKARRRPLEEKTASSLIEKKLGPIDYPLAQKDVPHGRTYSPLRAVARDISWIGISFTGVGIPYIFWQSMGGGGPLARWISKTYPDIDLSSYDDQVVTMRSGERWSPWEMGIQTAVALPEDLASGDYKVAFSGLVRHDDCDLEALREFVRKGGYLVVTGNELSVLPSLVPEVVGCYSSQAWNQKPRGLCVDAELTKASAPLAKGLSEASRWCIPWHCPLLKVLDPSKVSVLVVSQFLKAREPQGDGVLAALIPYGKGYILCSAGTMSPLSEILDIPDDDPKMHIPLVEGLVANFTVAGLRGTSIQSAANQALIDSKTDTVH